MSWHRKLPNQAACGSCCGIKEKLQTLWDRTINSILRINQVEPDDQGNIRIVSADDAVVITEGTNEIQIGLDQSELPAASVVTVNGKRGYVVLKAEDITDRNNLTLQHDLDAIANDIQGVRNSVSTEAQNRQDADTALQNNINTLQASIPQEAADAVAADPTIQLLVAADAQNVKLTGAQNVQGVKTFSSSPEVPTEATGSYSDKAANSNKVKAELDNYPLVVRTTGTQTIGGNKSFNTFIDMTAGTTELRIFDNAAKTNQIAAFGVRYRTGTSTNASIKSYAPKVDPSDPNEVQHGGFLQLVSNQDGTMELVIFGTNASGTLVRKSLAYFNGSAWN